MAYTAPSIIDNVTVGDAAFWLAFHRDAYDQAIADAIGGGGGGTQAGIYMPEMFDANAGSGGDDTSAIQQAWDAVKAAGGGTMMLGPKTYLVYSHANMTTGGGNSIIKLGSTGASNRTYRVQGFPHFSRIQTNSTNGSYGAGGPPSVVGGPTFEQIGGSLNQIVQFIEWSGVDIYAAVGGGLTGPSYSALDLGKYVKAHVSNSKFSSTAPASLPIRNHTFGLRLPIGLTHGKNHAEYINSTGWFAGFVIHTAHLILLNTVPKWCVMGYGIDSREGADNHSAFAGYLESEWCNYHIGGWHPTLGVEDLPATRQFYITGSWDTEDMDPAANGGVTLTGNVTSGSPTISGVADTGAVTVDDYIVSSKFARATTALSKTATTITASSNSFGTATGDTFQIGGEESGQPIWWYTLFHVFDLNNRIFGHLDWQNVRGNVGITAIQPIKRGGENLNVSRIANLQGSIPPAARVYRTAVQAIPNNTPTILDFPTGSTSEGYDTRDLHSLTLNSTRFTAPVAGIYQLGACVEWEANVTGRRMLSLLINGTNYWSDSRVAVTTAGAVTRQPISTVVNMAAGDFAQAEVLQVSGVSLNVQVTGGLSPVFTMTYLGNLT